MLLLPQETNLGLCGSRLPLSSRISQCLQWAVTRTKPIDTQSYENILPCAVEISKSVPKATDPGDLPLWLYSEGYTHTKTTQGKSQRPGTSFRANVCFVSCLVLFSSPPEVPFNWSSRKDSHCHKWKLHPAIHTEANGTHQEQDETYRFCSN